MLARATRTRVRSDCDPGTPSDAASADRYLSIHSSVGCSLRLTSITIVSQTGGSIFKSSSLQTSVIRHRERQMQHSEGTTPSGEKETTALRLNARIGDWCGGVHGRMMEEGESMVEIRIRWIQCVTCISLLAMSQSFAQTTGEI